jgi:hypothetical protein
LLGQDTLPAIILNGYYYRYKVKEKKDPILSGAKRKEEESVAGSRKQARFGKAYCRTKKKFYSEATAEEMEGDLVFTQDREKNKDAHRILQCRLR